MRFSRGHEAVLLVYCCEAELELKMLVFVEEREKKSSNNKPNPHVTSGPGIESQTTVVGCESSQHCAISAPHIMQTQVPPAPPHHPFPDFHR